MSKPIIALAEQIAVNISDMKTADAVSCLNRVREILHEVSPFSAEPVDFVRWVSNSEVMANDYNPNSVAPPEMELLRTSIRADGYTQPIVGNEEDGKVVVVDGFHRHRVGKECEDIQDRIKGYLPVVQIRAEQVSREDRMASTVRHNRARGKHKVEAMSEMVIELKRRNWSNQRISRELGMDQDEVLRLCQITGLMEVFSGEEFSEAWEAQGHIDPVDFEDISGRSEDYEEGQVEFRATNTDDPNRRFHTFDQWECQKAGFYKTRPPEGMTAEQCKDAYADFLADESRFREALSGVTSQWVNSCEHYLTNSAMNRIAWLGQAAMCFATSVPCEFRGGYSRLTPEQQLAADLVALEYLNEWFKAHDMDELTLEEAVTSRQVDIY